MAKKKAFPENKKKLNLNNSYQSPNINFYPFFQTNFSEYDLSGSSNYPSLDYASTFWSYDNQSKKQRSQRDELEYQCNGPLARYGYRLKAKESERIASKLLSGLQNKSGIDLLIYSDTQDEKIFQMLQNLQMQLNGDPFCSVTFILNDEGFSDIGLACLEWAYFQGLDTHIAIYLGKTACDTSDQSHKVVVNILDNLFDTRVMVNQVRISFISKAAESANTNFYDPFKKRIVRVQSDVKVFWYDQLHDSLANWRMQLYIPANSYLEMKRLKNQFWQSFNEK